MKGELYMKKLLCSMLTILILTGCGSNSKKEESKICSYSLNGIPVNFKMDSLDDIVNKIEMEMKYPSSMTKGTDLSKLTDSDLMKIGDAALKNMNITAGKGIDAKFTVKDQSLNAIITFDLKNGDAAILKKLGITGNTKNVKLSETVKSLETQGSKCVDSK